MNSKIKNILQFLLAAGLCMFLYILVHESGHLIVMLSAGAVIEDFSILTAHVTATGGDYTKTRELWLHANGAILPMICSFVSLLLYKKDRKSPFYHFFSYLVALFPLGSMLAWVFIPFSYINGNAPVSDDVTHFLNIFSEEYHPLIVSAVSVVIMGIDIAVMVKKDMIRTIFTIVKEN